MSPLASECIDISRFQPAIDALRPILDDLPPVLVAIDGRRCVGKTTLGRFLAWQFQVSLLESDNFMSGERGLPAYRLEDIQRVVDSRLRPPGERPVIVDGICLQHLLRRIERPAQFTIYVESSERGVIDPNDLGLTELERAILQYEAEIEDRKGDLILVLRLRNRRERKRRQPMDPHDALQTTRILLESVHEETSERHMRLTIRDALVVVRRGLGLEESSVAGGGAVPWEHPLRPESETGGVPDGAVPRETDDDGV